MKRYANKKDINQAAIVDAFRGVGASVYVMNTPCDLLVGIPGYSLLVEVKQVRKRGRRNEKTPAQIKFINEWKGQYAIVYTPDEAIELVNSYRSKSHLNLLHQSNGGGARTDQLDEIPGRNEIHDDRLLGIGHVKPNGQATGKS
jgi:hypothetical protein